MKKAAPVPRLKPFDLTKYLGSEENDLPAPYTSTQLSVLSLGTVGLLAILQVRGRVRMRRAARAVSEHYRRHFHPDPNK